MRRFLAAWIALVVPTAGSAAPATERPLEGDSRLMSRITVARRDLPLGVLLPILSKEVAVPLSAARETADDKVTLFMEERPAIEVLSRLSDHFGFTWIKDGKGYQLTQDLRSRREEAALQEREKAGQLAELRGRMERIVALASLSPEQLEARRVEAATRVREPGLAPGEGKALQEEVSAILALRQPGGMAAAAAYRALSPGQVQQLSSGRPLSFSTAEGSLPPAIVEQAHQATKDLRSGPRFLSATVGGGGVALGPPPAPSGPPTRVDLTIRIGTPTASRGPAALNLAEPRMEFSFTCHYGTDGKQMITPVGWSPHGSPRATAPATITDDPTLKQQFSLSGPTAGAAPDRGAITGSALPSGAITLGEVGERLHQATALEILADSFIHARVIPSRLAAKQEVVQLLDTIARDLDYTWEKEGNLIRFRSRHYYHDRPAEVADRILRPWEAQVKPLGAPGLNDLGTLAAALTDAQAAGMDRYWTWYLEKSKIPPVERPGGFYGAREHLRFWAGLGMAQRKAALNGELLPVGRMSRIQAQAFARAVNSQDETGGSGPGQLVVRQGDGPAPSPGALTPAAIAAGGFQLRASEQTLNSFSGTTEDGQSVNLRTIGGPQGGQPMPPNVPGLIITSSSAQILDQFVFSYHLAGDSIPPRTARISVPRPQPKPKVID